MVQVLSSDPFLRLSDREPTPPSENDEIIEETLKFLSSDIVIEHAVKPTASQPGIPPTQDTPPASSPQLHTPSASGSGGESRKRVAFSGWKNYHQAPIYTSDGTVTTPLKPLPPSRERRLLKSILKAQAPSPTGDGLSSPSQRPDSQTFGGMLDSIANQLTTDDIDNRNDAYTTLLASLQAFDNVPDAASLVDKLPILTKAILRDMRQSDKTPETVNRLELNAIKLLAALIRLPQVAENLDVPFGQALLEEIIVSFHNTDVTKQRVIARLQLLVHLPLKPQMMNNDRMHRLLSGLKAIDCHRSNGILGARLLVLHRILKQVPDLMSSHASKLLAYMFQGFLSVHNEIRARAIELAIVSGRTLGDRPEITKSVKDLLERKANNGQTYGEFIVQRLDLLLKDRHHSQDVPQIWASVILMLRYGPPSSRIKWSCMKTWLRLIQNCLNCSDVRTKVRAYMAWNCFIYTSQPGLDTSDQLRDLLLTPLRKRLAEKEDDNNRRPRSSAFYSYCNLLYYSLKPTASREQIDIYWTRYVEKVIATMPHGSRSSVIQISRVLVALLGGFPQKPWVEGRAISDLGTTSMSCKPQELCPLEPKWIRGNTKMVIQVFEKILTPDTWSLAHGPDLEHICSPRDIWLALLSAISDAGSKEISLTREAKSAFSHIFAFLFRFWSEYKASKPVLFSSSFKDLATDMAQKLSPLIFVDKFLTPHDGSLQGPNTSTCGLFEILELVLSIEDETIPDEAFFNHLETVQQIVRSALPCLPTPRSQLDLLSDVHRIVVDGSTAADPKLAKMLKDFFETEAIGVINATASTQSSPVKFPELLPPLLRICKSALKQSALTKWPCTTLISSIYTSSVKGIRDSVGNVEVVRLMTEPLSKSIMEEHKSDGSIEGLSAFCISMLETETPPPVFARTKGAATSWKGKRASRSRKQTETGPYESFFQLIDHLSQVMLRESTRESEWNAALPTRYLRSLANFLRRLPAAYRNTSFSALQNTVSLWLNHGTPFHGKSGTEPPFVALVRELNETMWNCIVTINANKSQLLASYEPFVKASLQSRYRSVLNVSIREWNACFEGETDIIYPSSIKEIVDKLRSVIELELPGLDDAGSRTPTHVQSLFFAEEDEKENTVMLVSRMKSPLFRSTQPVPLSPSRRANVPADCTTRPFSTLRDQVLRPSLRHDDSQIMFLSIDPSEDTSDAPMESQLLTDRQKEVRERQAQDNAVFSDLRSDLESAQASETVTEPRQGSEAPSLSLSKEQQGPTTPTILRTRNTIAMENYLSSSPTPGSAMKRREAMRHQSHEDLDFDEDIPSSPPDVEDPELERIMEDIPADTGADKAEEENQEEDACPPEPPVSDKPSPGSLHKENPTINTAIGPASTMEDDQATLDDDHPISQVEAETNDTETSTRVPQPDFGSRISGSTAEISMTDLDPSAPTKEIPCVDATEDSAPVPPGSVSPATQLAWEAAESFRREVDVVGTSPCSSLAMTGAQLQTGKHDDADGTSTSSDTGNVQVPCTELKSGMRDSEHQMRSHKNVLSDEGDVSRVVDSFPCPLGDVEEETNAQQGAAAAVSSLSRKRSRDPTVFDKPAAKRPQLDGDIVIPSTETSQGLEVPVVPRRLSPRISARTRAQNRPAERNEKRISQSSPPTGDSDSRDRGTTARRTRSAGPLDVNTSFYQPERTRADRKTSSIAKETAQTELPETNVLPQKRRRTEGSPGDNRPKNGHQNPPSNQQPPSTPQNAPDGLSWHRGSDVAPMAHLLPKLDFGTNDMARSTPSSLWTGSPRPPVRSLMRASFEALSSLSPFRFRSSQDVQTSQDSAGSATEPNTPSRTELNGKRKWDVMQEEDHASQGEMTESQTSRAVLTPRSIMDRLKGVLEDCKKLAFAGKEEREVDDLLFELRKEVHEAARRGRDLEVDR